MTYKLGEKISAVSTLVSVNYSDLYSEIKLRVSGGWRTMECGKSYMEHELVKLVPLYRALITD